MANPRAWLATKTMATKAFPQVLLGCLSVYLVDFSTHPFPPATFKLPKKYPLFWSTILSCSALSKVPKNSPFLPPFSDQKGSSFPLPPKLTKWRPLLALASPWPRRKRWTPLIRCVFLEEDVSLIYFVNFPRAFAKKILCPGHIAQDSPGFFVKILLIYFVKKIQDVLLRYP